MNGILKSGVGKCHVILSIIYLLYWLCMEIISNKSNEICFIYEKGREVNVINTFVSEVLTRNSFEVEKFQDES